MAHCGRGSLSPLEVFPKTFNDDITQSGKNMYELKENGCSSGSGYRHAFI